MIDEKSFLNQPEEIVDMESNEDNIESILDLPEVKNEEKQVRTKHEAQEDVFEKFGIRKTSDFTSALQNGSIEFAREWLNHIVEHKEDFPQYTKTWDNWLNDRHNEIDFYEDLQAREGLDGVKFRSKDEAQQELVEKFGMRKTSDFREALKNDNIEFAEQWLDYVVNNKNSFPQYLSTWNNWLSDRKRELADAKSKLGK